MRTQLRHTARAETGPTPSSLAAREEVIVTLEWIRTRRPGVDQTARDSPLKGELIVDQARIGLAIAMLTRMSSRGRFFVQDTWRGDPLIVDVIVNDDGVLTVQCKPIEGKGQLELVGPGSLFRFSWEAGTWPLAPTRLWRFRHRKYRRVRVPSRVRVRFPHPVVFGYTVDAQVVDISAQGIGFLADTISNVLLPGLEIDELELYWKGGRPIRLRGEIRQVNAESRELHHCGARVEPFDPHSAVSWASLLESIMHPNTRREGTTADELWDLYSASGYFSLSGKRTDAFQHLRSSFQSAKSKIERAPEIGGYFYWRSRRRLEASITQLEVWEGSWLVYQLARYPVGRSIDACSDSVLADLYAHAYEHVQMQPSARWLVAYVQRVARFSRQVHYDVPARYVDSGHASITPFRAMEIPCDAARNNVLAPASVREATPSELNEVFAAFSSQRPEPYVQATGLSSADLGLGQVKNRWRRNGLHRDRAVFVAEDERGRRAAVVVESGDAGLHLFGLIDLARIIALSPDGYALVPRLLRAAQDWYRRLGKTSFVYFSEDDPTPEEPAPAGPGSYRPVPTGHDPWQTDEAKTVAATGPSSRAFRTLGDGYLTVLDIAMAPELIEHSLGLAYTAGK